MTGIHRLVTFAVTLVTLWHCMPTDGFLRVCYFASWTRYRPGMAQYYVGDIDANICTHLIYAFGKLDRGTLQIVPTDIWLEDEGGNYYRDFNNNKLKNPALKTLLSIGGQNDHSDGFVAVSQTDAILSNFVNTTIKFLRDRNFDGLDIDWEFPDATTRDIHTRLLKALREGFDRETTDPTRRLLLTIAGAAGQWFIDPGYNVPEVAKYVDFANLMTYDYSSKSNALTAFNSPLYARSDPSFNPVLNTNWTVHHWNKLGLPFSKIVVGVTGVGRWLVLNMTSLSDNPDKLVGAETTGEVRSQPDYGIEAGMAYPEICQWLKKPNTTKYFDDEQKNPYLVNGDNWVGYEDEQSIEIKVKWMEQLGVAGLMFWALDQDDFSGNFCGRGKYPLLQSVITTAQKTPTPTTPTTTPTTPTTTPTTPTTTPTTTTRRATARTTTPSNSAPAAALTSAACMILLLTCLFCFGFRSTVTEASILFCKQ